MSAPLIEIIGLSKAFPLRGGLFGGIRGDVKAVTDVSFSLAKGDVFGLAGESGSGKSTIARMIMGLTHPSAGAILLDGLDLTGLPLALAFADRGLRVVIYDVSVAAVESVNAGRLPFAEPGAGQVLARVLARPRPVCPRYSRGPTRSVRSPGGRVTWS